MARYSTRNIGKRIRTSSLGGLAAVLISITGCGGSGGNSDSDNSSAPTSIDKLTQTYYFWKGNDAIETIIELKKKGKF